MQWAGEAQRPLSVYAAGLLARAMGNQEVAASYREQTSQLVGPQARFLLLLPLLQLCSPLQVPVMIQRLHQLQAHDSRSHQLLTQEEQEEEAGSSKSRPDSALKPEPSLTRPQASSGPAGERGGGGGGGRCAGKENGRKAKQKLNVGCSSEEVLNDPSSSSSEGSSAGGPEPLSRVLEQRLLLQYLTPLGDHQEVRGALAEDLLDPEQGPGPTLLCPHPLPNLHPGSLCSCSPSSCRWTRCRC